MQIKKKTKITFFTSQISNNPKDEKIRKCSVGQAKGTQVLSYIAGGLTSGIMPVKRVIIIHQNICLYLTIN